MYNAKILTVLTGLNGRPPFAVCQFLGSPAEAQEFKAIRDNCGQGAQIEEDGTVTFTVGITNFIRKGIPCNVGAQFKMDTSTGNDGITRTFVVTNTAKVVQEYTEIYREVMIRQMLGQQQQAAPALQPEPVHIEGDEPPIGQ